MTSSLLAMCRASHFSLLALVAAAAAAADFLQVKLPPTHDYLVKDPAAVKSPVQPAPQLVCA